MAQERRRRMKDESLTSENETVYEDDEIDVPKRKHRSRYSSRYRFTKRRGRKQEAYYANSSGARNESEVD